MSVAFRTASSSYQKNKINQGCFEDIGAFDARYWAAYTIMIFELILDLQGQIQGQRNGKGYLPEITSARVPRWSQTVASLPGQLAQP